MTRSFKLIWITVAVIVAAGIFWGIHISNRRPICEPFNVLLADEVDRRLNDSGYVVLRRMDTMQGCYYRMVNTPLGLRAIVIYDANSGQIVISRWDYVE